jgi:hypothetical protein
MSLVAWLLTLAVHLQAQSALPQSAAPKIVGTEVASEFSWERESDLMQESHTASFGVEPFHITFKIAYRGLKQVQVPESVDLQLVRDDASPADASGRVAPPALAVIDALEVPLTRQTAEGPDRIVAVVPFEVFQWMVGGRTLDFEAFGRHFVLAARQIAILKDVAVEWSHAGSVIR